MPIFKPIKRVTPAIELGVAKPSAVKPKPVTPTTKEPVHNVRQQKRLFTLAQVFKMQSMETRNKAKEVITHSVTPTNMGGGGVIAKMFNYDPYAVPPPSIYVCSITGINPDLTSVAPIGLKFSCNCERFKFVHDYALFYHGLSFRKFSTNVPPLQTNPGYKGVDGFGICKHLYGLAYNILSGRVKIKKVKGAV